MTLKHLQLLRLEENQPSQFLAVIHNMMNFGIGLSQLQRIMVAVGIVQLDSPRFIARSAKSVSALELEITVSEITTINKGLNNSIPFTYF